MRRLSSVGYEWLHDLADNPDLMVSNNQSSCRFVDQNLLFYQHRLTSHVLLYM